eukprot:7593214-Alexandrium_andersonii.AAC.1
MSTVSRVYEQRERTGADQAHRAVEGKKRHEGRAQKRGGRSEAASIARRQRRRDEIARRRREYRSLKTATLADREAEGLGTPG